MRQIYPTKQEFVERAKRFACVPLHTEIIADMITPVASFLRLGGGKGNGFLCESVKIGEKFGRYSFLGVEPRVIFSQSGPVLEVQVTRGGPVPPTNELSVLDCIKQLLSSHQPFDASDSGIAELPFIGGAVGYYGFEAPIIATSRISSTELPHAIFMLSDLVIVFDHVKQRATIVCSPTINGNPEDAYEIASKRIADVQEKIQGTWAGEKTQSVDSSPYEGLDKKTFVGAIESAQKAIRSDLARQLFISARETTAANCNTFGVYRMLRTILPSETMFFYQCNGVALAGASPDLFLLQEKDSLTLREAMPLRELEEAVTGLRDSYGPQSKERIMRSYLEQHIQMVSAAQAELHKVCKPGSIHLSVENYVSDAFSSGSDDLSLVPYETVVKGKLKPGVDVFQVFRALFPSAKIVGVPKEEALGLIKDIEGLERGVFGGTFGCFSFAGGYEGCNIVDTIVKCGDIVQLQAGIHVRGDTDTTKAVNFVVGSMAKLRSAVDQARTASLLL